MAARKNIIISVFFIVVILLGIIFLTDQDRNKTVLKSLDFKSVEIARTQEELAKGLMNRDSLCEKCGMLFVFQESSPKSFWMKNTKISLDIIFIDKEYKVKKIHRNTNPFQTKPTYNSDVDVKYVLEINANQSDQLDIQVGNIIDIEKILKEFSK